MATDATIKQVSVKKVFHNPPANGKKENWKIYTQTEGESYTVFDAMIAAQLEEGATKNVSTTSKEFNGKLYHNIVGIAPPAGFGDVPESFEDPFAGLPTANVPQVKEPVSKPVVPELALMVEERMRAYDSAVTLAGNGKIDYKQIVAFADKALAYYRDSSLPEQKSSSAPTDTALAEEYLK